MTPDDARTADNAVVAAINERTGAALTVSGRSDQGTLGGAIFVDWPDGRRGVVTRYLGLHGTLAEAERLAAVLAYARERGLPVPGHDLVVGLADGVALVQERLAGRPAAQVTPAVIDATVAANDRFAGLLADRPDVAKRPLSLTRSGDPYPRHEVLAAHSARSRRLLDRIVGIGARAPGEMRGTDLVHVDLTADNVLFDDGGAVSGIVDWNLGAYRGDRLFALVKTRFDREWLVQSPDPDPVEIAATARLDDILVDRIEPQTLQKYWAHWLLFQLHWTLPSAPPDVVAWHLAFAESRLL